MGKHSLLVRYPPALSSLSPELILHSEAIERADQLLGTILGTLEEAQIANETLVLVTADHGGAGSHHGAFNNENIRVPFLAKGPNVRKNFSISSYVRNMDTSPTALAALGVEAPDSWVGRAADIFVSVDAAETVSYDDAYSQRVKRIFLVGVAGPPWHSNNHIEIGRSPSIFLRLSMYRPRPPHALLVAHDHLARRPLHTQEDAVLPHAR